MSSPIRVLSARRERSTKAKANKRVDEGVEWVDKLIGNPLLTAYLAGPISTERFLYAIQHRQELARRYSWAIPNEVAINTLVKYSPVVEIGAGRGYWASLVREAGGQILAYDQHVPKKYGANAFHPEASVFFPVMNGGPRKLQDHPDHALFLCWPPERSPMALDCLHNYSGDTVIYIGWEYCTGDVEYHRELRREWRVKSVVAIPQWADMEDVMIVYKRRKKRKGGER